ncbi:MAG TPA: arylesterase [Steroidobacteraceae bacterium]|nr:arylesterase [Steroidobacteraceae bacterium]
MLRRLYFALLFFALILPAAYAAPTPSILVFGDSISAAYGMRVEEGWVSLLQKKLSAQGYGYHVVNASVSGETTDGGRARLARALEVHHPAIVILELGGNDGLRGLPLDEAKSNLEAMIGMSAKGGAGVLLLGMRIPPNYGAAYTEKFHAIYGELARKYRLPFVPFLLDKVALNPDMIQADGLHPNAQAQPRLLDAIWPTLQSLLTRS